MIQTHYVNTRPSRPHRASARSGSTSTPRPEIIRRWDAVRHPAEHRICASNPAPHLQRHLPLSGRRDDHGGQRALSFTRQDLHHVCLGRRHHHAPEAPAQFYQSQRWDNPPMSIGIGRSVQMAAASGGTVHQWTPPVVSTLRGRRREGSRSTGDCAIRSAGIRTWASTATSFFITTRRSVTRMSSATDRAAPTVFGLILLAASACGSSTTDGTPEADDASPENGGSTGGGRSTGTGGGATGTGGSSGAGSAGAPATGGSSGTAGPAGPVAPTGSGGSTGGGGWRASTDARPRRDHRCGAAPIRRSSNCIAGDPQRALELRSSTEPPGASCPPEQRPYIDPANRQVRWPQRSRRNIAGCSVTISTALVDNDAAVVSLESPHLPRARHRWIAQPHPPSLAITESAGLSARQPHPPHRRSDLRAAGRPDRSAGPDRPGVDEHRAHLRNGHHLHAMPLSVCAELRVGNAV
jgi:hypothetical protein